MIDTPNWKGRSILHPRDVDHLEMTSAKYEFGDGLPQHEAEERAYKEYLHSRQIEAAAHHLRGMQQALALGDKRSSQKHAALYQLHAQALGADPVGPPHPDIKSYMDKNGPKYRFRAHKADVLADPEIFKSQEYKKALSKMLHTLEELEID